MSLFRGYVAAKGCSDGPQPGAVALKDACLAAVPASRNDGIFNCRDQRGSTLWSVHAEGRAFDWGCKAGAVWARAAADFLVAHSAQLGIQCVIYDRRIWSGAHPDSGWRAYHGVDAHTTHLHVELSWAAALHLTQAKAAAVLADLTGDDMDLNDKVSNVWTPPAKEGAPPTFEPVTVNEVLRRASRNYYLGTEARDTLRAHTKALAEVAATQAAILAAVKGVDAAGIKKAIDDAVTAALSDITVTLTNVDA